MTSRQVKGVIGSVTGAGTVHAHPPAWTARWRRVAGRAGGGLPILAAAVFVSGLLAPAAVAVPPVGGSVEPPAAGPRQTEPEALGAARVSGRRVEVAGEHTGTRQVFANPDGTFTSETSALPRWVRHAGGWAPVDTTLRVGADGGVAPVATAFPVAFSGGGGGPLARIADGDRAVSMSWPGALPPPVLSGSTATYRNVLPDVDLQVTASPVGFAEVLVVRTPAAAASPALADLEFGLHADGVTVAPDGTGGLAARDPSGRQVFHSAPPMMWDSSGTGGPVARLSAPRAGDRSAVMTTRLGADRLVVLPDPGLLAGAVFPLYIDPSWTGGKQAWAMVDKAFPNQEYWNPAHRPESGHYGPGTKRTFFRMDSNNVNGKHILHAAFRITETYAWSCNARRVDLYLTGSISSSTNWNHQPSWATLLDHLNVAHGYNSSCGDAGLEFTVTPAIVTAASHGWSNTTLGLRANDETDVFGWKGYSTNPSLVVTYNTPPSKPSGRGTHPGTPCVTGGSRPVVNAGTAESPITLLATVFDPDTTKDSVRAEFQVHRFDPATSTWQDVTAGLPGDGRTTYVSSSSKTTRSLTLASLDSAATGSAYSWRVRAFDGTDGSAWTSWCEFTVDTTKPGSLPVVTSTDYPANTPDDWHGGVGQAGSFTLRPGPGDSDVIAYRYAVDDPNEATPGTQVAAGEAGDPVTVRVAPMHFFENTLYVYPVDRAGNVGAHPAVYDFYVNTGAGPVAHWALDEATGSTAGDSTGGGHTATLVGGVGWTRGRVNGALSADGSTGYAATTGPVVRTDQGFSVSAWVRLTDTSHTATVMTQSGTWQPGFQLYYSAAYKRWIFNRFIADSATHASDDIVRAISDEPPRAGVWTHLVGVYDEPHEQVRLYIDGALQSITGRFTTPWNAMGPVQIGRVRVDGSIHDYFPGDIDDVKIWNRILSDDPRTVSDPALTNEIAAMATQPPAPRAAWAFDEGTGTAGADSSGLGHPATLAGGATWNPDGHDGIGPALGLDGATGYASTTGPVVRTDHSFSVAARVRLTGTGDGGLPGRAETAVGQDGAVNSGFYLGYRPVGGVPGWSFMLQTADTSTAIGVTTTSDEAHAPAAGEWAQLVGVYDDPARQIRLYVNGQLVDELPFTTPWNAAGPVQIGRVKYGGSYTDYWPGDIDDVRIFTGTLTDRQVLNLFIGIPPV